MKKWHKLTMIWGKPPKKGIKIQIIGNKLQMHIGINQEIGIYKIFPYLAEIDVC